MDEIPLTAPDPTRPLDVWLRIPARQEEAEAEANTYVIEDRFDVQWYSTAVGLVHHVWFDTYEAARGWLLDAGFEDFTDGAQQ